MEYMKINSVWKRHGWYFEENKKKMCDPAEQHKRQEFINGDYARSEFANIKNWRITEKIDGTNIRIEYSKFVDTSGSDEGLVVEDFSIKGRTESAQIPPHLLDYLQTAFKVDRLKEIFEGKPFKLYGEGYGPKIQEPMGSKYAGKPGFVLFDVMVGRWWLKYEDVAGIAEQIGIPVVPNLGIMTLEAAEWYVKSSPKSIFSQKPQLMEGIVATAEPMVCFRDGEPVKTKLKLKDF